MLTLISGSALGPVRAHLLAHPNERHLFVLPNELAAQSLRESYAGSSKIVAIDFAAVLDALFAKRAQMAKWISPEMALLITRGLIESDPGSYDYLVGRNSVPRLTPGILQRIVSAMNRLVQRDQVDPELAGRSIRERQLRTLSDRFSQVLMTAGVQLQTFGMREALANYPRNAWESAFPGVEEVTLLDFDTFDDSHFFFSAMLRRAGVPLNVLLDIDPEVDHLAAGSENAYMRFCDMADIDLRDHADVRHLPAYDIELDPAVAVEFPSVSQEMDFVVNLCRGFHIRERSIVLAVTNADIYEASLETSLEEEGFEVSWLRRTRLLDSVPWKLLEKLADCVGSQVTGSSVAALLRAPGFGALLDDDPGFVKVWDLASRLDYMQLMAGKVTGWRRIMSSVKVSIETLQADRRARGHISDLEVSLDSDLVQILAACHRCVDKFLGKSEIATWCDLASEVLSKISAVDKTVDPVAGELSVVLEELKNFSSLVTERPIRFRQFVSYLRTLLHGRFLEDVGHQTRTGITVCNMNTAPFLRSDLCIVVGVNDGNLPSFPRSDSDYLGQSFQHSREMHRQKQFTALQRCRLNHRNLVLCTPEVNETEDLLPSQFLEEMLQENLAICLPADTVLMRFSETGKLAQSEAGPSALARRLKGVVLEANELRDFQRLGSKIHNIAHSATVMASRLRPDLSEHDGVITDPVLLKWLEGWSNRHIYSVSQLDSAVACSFRFFADRILNLEEIDEADDLLPAHTFGSFVHDVLSRFYRGWVAEGRGIPCAEDEALSREKLVAAYRWEKAKTEVLSTFARDLLVAKLFGEYDEESFEASELALADSANPGVFGLFLLMEMRRGSDPALELLSPSNFEVGFGMGRQEEDDPLTTEEYLELELTDGEKIKLRGRIDRIDVSPTGAFAVTDYKTGAIPTKRQILDGFRTQLPVYTLVGQELLKRKYAVPEGAGGLYYSLKRGDNVKVSGVFLRQAYQKATGVAGRSCLTDDEFTDTMERVKLYMARSLKAVRRGHLTSTRYDPESVCRFCSFAELCYRDVERTQKFYSQLEAEANGG